MCMDAQMQRLQDVKELPMQRVVLASYR
jgi:hypothetical protein